MTECERFVKEGKFYQEFFKEEVRNGFRVDEKRKKVWAVCLDMLMQLDSVCKKHGLQYYLLYGSLLGAVRHHGFIPWDDDLDVVMFREDFEKLSGLGEEFVYPYFLQNAHTDPGVGSPVMKIRNSNTCQFNKFLNYGGFNSGIALDIFPLDNYKEETAQAEFDEIYRIKYKNILYMKNKSPHRSQKDIDLIKQYLPINPEEVCNEIHAIARKHENENTIKVWAPIITLYDFSKSVFYKEDFGKTVYMDFEGFKWPCPSGWDRILKTIYGDYMQFPPMEKRGTWHSSSVFDPDLPYIDYIKELGITPNIEHV